MSVRVRYAPSPTGSPHVGNVRTALFDYLLARHFGGQFIVRLEDTDRTRFIEGCEEEILESLRYVGATWDEGPDIGGPNGPYRQSERKEAGMYASIIQRLLDEGHAYYAFETPEELTEMREFQQINKKPTGYFGGDWRDASAGKVAEAQAAGKPGVIRLRMPRDTRIVINDAIRGRVEVDSNTQDDAVLIKADGMPTYHFAAIADDHLMGITHVIRGEEWISSAPKHVWMIQSLGWDQPEWVHVPVINGKDGKKLSKRHGDTRCLDYRDAGYLGNALANFIALIGWAPGEDREVMTMDEMAEAFSLEGLQPSPGVFDPDKLNWMNGHHIRAMAPAELEKEVLAFAALPTLNGYWSERENGAQVIGELGLLQQAASAKPARFHRAMELEQERVTTLAEFGPACAFFFADEPPMDEKAVAKWFGEAHVATLFQRLDGWLVGLSTDPTQAEIEEFLRSVASELGFEKLGPIVHPTRVAMTG
ncbi:MAG: glutamate--tRNA ligase, partial [Fimbriimonadaceae bacterium]|nr:glutamate--tRNA ligase [Fimbriimonadaceae bacterium]